MDNQPITDNERKPKCSHINLRMIPSKLAYFFLYAAAGSYMPFKNIFMVSVGLQVNEASFISGITYIFGIIAGPCWGFLADMSGKRKLIFVLLCLGCASNVFAHPWVALQINNKYYTNCQQSIVTSNYTDGSNPPMHQSVNRSETNSSVLSCVGDRTPFANPLFTGMITLLSVTNIFLMPLYGSVDSFVMNIVKTSKEETSFGSQRVFGSMSFGLWSFISGVAADNYYHPKLSRYTAVFYVYLPIILLVIPLGLWLLKQTHWDVENEEKEEQIISEDDTGEISKTKLILTAFKNLNNIFFFFSVFINGMLSMIVLNFLFLLMKDEMKASKTAMGLAMFISCFSEVSMFPFSKRIMRFLGGPTISMEIALFSNCLRLIIISYIENPWISLIVNVLHGIGFALFWAAAVEFLQQISSKAVYNTMSCILTSIFTGCAGMAANVGGGAVYNVYGGRTLCKGAAAVGAVWLVAMIIYFHLVRFIGSGMGSKKQQETNKEDLNLTSNEII